MAAALCWGIKRWGYKDQKFSKIYKIIVYIVIKKVKNKYTNPLKPIGVLVPVSVCMHTL